MTRASELREYDVDALEARLTEVKAELFNLRFQLATGQFDRTHRFKELRSEVARILTILGEQATEEADVAVEAAIDREGEGFTWRQRLRARRRARHELLGRVEEVAAGHAGEGVEIVAPTPAEEEEESEPEALDEEPELAPEPEPVAALDLEPELAKEPVPAEPEPTPEPEALDEEPVAVPEPVAALGPEPELAEEPEPAEPEAAPEPEALAKEPEPVAETESEIEEEQE